MACRGAHASRCRRCPRGSTSPSLRQPKRTPLRRVLGFLLSSISGLALAGCFYGFAGGGLPPGIRTVAALPFENLTPEPTLTQEVQTAVSSAVQGRLGLRPAGETSADA